MYYETFLIFITLIYVLGMKKSKDSLQGRVLSFHHIGPSGRAQGMLGLVAGLTCWAVPPVRLWNILDLVSP